MKFLHNILHTYSFILSIIKHNWKIRRFWVVDPLKMNVCPSLQSDLDLQIRERSYSTRRSGTYVVPFPRVECIKINYKYQFICSWNNLPEELKNTTTLSVFKKKMTEYLIADY